MTADTELKIAGFWRKGPAPKDGTEILALFGSDLCVASYECWPVGGETPTPGNPGCPEEGYECRWCSGGDYWTQDEPDAWAEISLPSESCSVGKLAQWNEALKARNAKLVEALESFVTYHSGHVMEAGLGKKMQRARAALALAKGEA